MFFPVSDQFVKIIFQEILLALAYYETLVAVLSA